MYEQWLFTIEDFNGAPYQAGKPYRLWSWAPLDTRTGLVPPACGRGAVHAGLGPR